MSGSFDLNGIVHEWHACITCGVIYTCPKTMMDHQRKVGGFHYCCNGHSQGWTKEQSINEKTRLERDRLRQQLAQKDDEIREAQRKLAAASKKAAAVKKRAAAGTCPCCNRTVRQMAQHLKTKHPEFAATAVN